MINSNRRILVQYTRAAYSDDFRSSNIAKCRLLLLDLNSDISSHLAAIKTKRADNREDKISQIIGSASLRLALG